MVSIFFGALCDPIAVQLERQHVAVADKKRLAQLQRDADAVTRLVVNGIIPEMTARRARQKIFKKVCAIATPKNTRPARE
jgi:hypothetical protein